MTGRIWKPPNTPREGNVTRSCLATKCQTLVTMIRRRRRRRRRRRHKPRWSSFSEWRVIIIREEEKKKKASEISCDTVRRFLLSRLSVRIMAQKRWDYVWDLKTHANVKIATK